MHVHIRIVTRHESVYSYREYSARARTRTRYMHKWRMHAHASHERRAYDSKDAGANIDDSIPPDRKPKDDADFFATVSALRWRTQTLPGARARVLRACFPCIYIHVCVVMNPLSQYCARVSWMTKRLVRYCYISSVSVVVTCVCIFTCPYACVIICTSRAFFLHKYFVYMYKMYTCIRTCSCARAHTHTHTQNNTHTHTHVVSTINGGTHFPCSQWAPVFDRNARWSAKAMPSLKEDAPMQEVLIPPAYVRMFCFDINVYFWTQSCYANILWCIHIRS
jgi:hypothetical protein